MGGRLKKPNAPEPAPDIEESGSPEATMATATTIMMAVIKRSNIIFPSWSSQTLWKFTSHSPGRSHCIPKHKSPHGLSKKRWSLSKKMQVSISVHCKARRAHAYEFSCRRSRRRQENPQARPHYFCLQRA